MIFCEIFIYIYTHTHIYIYHGWIHDFRSIYNSPKKLDLNGFKWIHSWNRRSHANIPSRMPYTDPATPDTGKDMAKTVGNASNLRIMFSAVGMSDTCSGKNPIIIDATRNHCYKLFTIGFTTWYQPRIMLNPSNVGILVNDHAIFGQHPRMNQQGFKTVTIR